MITKSPAPKWMFHTLSLVEMYVLLTVAQAPGSAYMIWQSIPYDSDGVFTVTQVGVRRALARLLRSRYVELVDNPHGDRRGTFMI